MNLPTANTQLCLTVLCLDSFSSVYSSTQCIQIVLVLLVLVCLGAGPRTGCKSYIVPFEEQDQWALCLLITLLMGILSQEAGRSQLEALNLDSLKMAFVCNYV